MFCLIQILFIMHLFTFRNQNFLLHQRRSLCLEEGFSLMFFQRERENRPHLCCVYPATLRDERERVVVLLDADSSSASL